MMTTFEGIVLKERSYGENDKFIDILTKDHGVVEISVKGAKKINGKNGSSAQLISQIYDLSHHRNITVIHVYDAKSGEIFQ